MLQKLCLFLRQTQSDRPFVSWEMIADMQPSSVLCHSGVVMLVITLSANTSEQRCGCLTKNCPVYLNVFCLQQCKIA